ncbi:MAG: hypothetical protein M1835_005861 [Candelina submexicana]|nr:MAG: hypothetical protein M1835_005861 [Candelina submexicana]
MEEASPPPPSHELSPSPSVSPVPALSPCPSMCNRSISTSSSATTFSGRSTASGSFENGTSRRRGYVRPQATSFSDSALNRESVLSLGSIAHLQYYFARTGLLDGKGGQLAKSRKNGKASGGELSTLEASEHYFGPSQAFQGDDSTYSSMRSSPDVFLSGDEVQFSGGFVESPRHDMEVADMEPMMLPPTVSTYIYRTVEVQPPPDLNTLRINLRAALEDTRKVLRETEKEQMEQSNLHRTGDGGQDALDWVKTPNSAAAAPSEMPKTEEERPSQSSHLDQGWHELQGTHVLDIVTLTIRAARMYYTAHDEPARLSAIKSERKIRAELLAVMDVLKRMAMRTFAGGIRVEEREAIRSWVVEVEQLLVKEEESRKREFTELESWQWLDGDWSGREYEREWRFLKSFLKGSDTLPPWEVTLDVNKLPTPFLQSLQNGLLLVRLHNEMVRKSKRPFGEIQTYHTDTAKPYRCAENLRYWIKAAEIRWDVKLQVDVTKVVHGKSSESWGVFETAVYKWCGTVRQELSADLRR